MARKSPDPLQPGALVAAYIRDSGGTEQEMSEAQQEAVIRAFCVDKGYTLTRIFKDSRSGSSTTGRTGFEAMIEAMRKDPPERGVVIWKMSRFARDLTDAQYYKADLRRRGLQIVSLQDNLPGGPEGTLVENILDWANARYLSDLSTDTKRGIRYSVITHRIWMGNTPLGYKGVRIDIGVYRDGTTRTGRRLEPDDKAPLVRQAFEMRANGATLDEIHKALNLYPWRMSYVRLLRARIYTGTHIYNGEVIENFCPPIIDQALYNAVQRTNDTRSQTPPRSVRSRFWLGGLLYCANCGVLMTTHPNVTNGRRYDYYVCSRHENKMHGECVTPYIRKEQIEGLVVARMVDHILTPAVLDDLTTEARAIAGQVTEEQHTKRAQLEGRLVAVRAEIRRVVDAITAAGHSAALLDHLGRLEAEQNTILLSMSETVKPLPPVEVDVPNLVTSAREVLTDGSDQDRAQIAQGFIRRIEISAPPLSGMIHFSLPDAPAHFVDLVV